MSLLTDFNSEYRVDLTKDNPDHFKVRYKVLSEELQTEAKNDQKQEKDHFDDHSEHITVYYKNTPVSVMRLIKPPHVSLFEHGSFYFPFDTGEYSRIIVLKEYRKKLLPLLGVLQGGVTHSFNTGVKNICGANPPAFIDSLHRSGIHVISIGSTIEFHGVKQPLFFNLDQLLTHCYYDNYDIWEILTGGL